MKKWDVIHFDFAEPVFRGDMPSDLLLARLEANTLTWADLARPAGEKNIPWKRLFELEEFRIALPPVPFEYLENQHRKYYPSPKKSDKRMPETDPTLLAPLDLTLTSLENQGTSWFIQLEGAEFGPFSLEELKRVLKSGKLKGEVYLWNTHLENWVPVSSFAALSELLPQDGEKPRKIRRKKKQEDLEIITARDTRISGRQTLVATVSNLDTKEVIGVCANISEQGLQVLVDGDIGFEPDSAIKIRITPIGITGLSPFVATVKLAWVNPSAHRAGFRFNQLDPKDQKGLDQYLKTVRSRQFHHQAGLGQWIPVDESKKPAA